MQRHPPIRSSTSPSLKGSNDLSTLVTSCQEIERTPSGRGV